MQRRANPIHAWVLGLEQQRLFRASRQLAESAMNDLIYRL